MISIEDIRALTGKFPRRSVRLLLLCLAGVLVFAFGAIAPAYWNHVSVSQKIDATRRQIEENESLHPLFRSLQGLPKRSSPSLTIPRRVAMQRNAAEGISASFREIAGRHGMKVVSIVPNIVTAGDSQVLVVNMTLKGEYESFRDVLKNFGELPYLDRIEEFSLRRSANSRALDITMQVVLAVR